MLTQPQWLSLGVEEEALPLPLVGGGHVEVAADDALQVAVLPVQVTALDGPREHRSSGPGQGVCKEKNISALLGQEQPVPPPRHDLPGRSSAFTMAAKPDLTPVISGMDMGSGFGCLC